MRGILRAQDCKCGIEEIVDGAAFAHEFRIRTNEEVFASAFAARALQSGNDYGINAAGKHGAAHGNCVRALLGSERMANLFGCALHARKIPAAFAQAGTADAEEGTFALCDWVG